MRMMGYLGVAVLGVAVLGTAVLGVAVLGTAVLGVAVLGTAVLQPGPRIQPSLDFRGTFPKEHHTQHAVSSPIHDGPSNMGYLGVAVRGVAVLGTAVLHRTLTHSAQPWHAPCSSIRASQSSSRKRNQ